MIIQKLKYLIARSYKLGFRSIVAHQWSSSYLLRASGAHYRKAYRFLSKEKDKASSDWVGSAVWGSPTVALAPPRYVSFKIRNDAVISVTIGAREAMISFRRIYERSNGKLR
jgi:hypothetical protein